MLHVNMFLIVFIWSINCTFQKKAREEKNCLNFFFFARIHPDFKYYFVRHYEYSNKRLKMKIRCLNSQKKRKEKRVREGDC